MKRICVVLYLSVFAALAPATLSAQEITLGLGATDYGDVGEDSATFEVEYRHTPFTQRRVASFAWGANASVSAEGDVFLGGGIWARWQWNSGWFFENSVMPGLYNEGTSSNDLGSAFEIRTLLGLGYKFDNGSAVSAAFTHKSNASVAENNPGSNTYLVRYHISF